MRRLGWGTAVHEGSAGLASVFGCRAPRKRRALVALYDATGGDARSRAKPRHRFYAHVQLL